MHCISGYLLSASTRKQHSMTVIFTLLLNTVHFTQAAALASTPYIASDSNLSQAVKLNNLRLCEESEKTSSRSTEKWDADVGGTSARLSRSGG